MEEKLREYYDYLKSKGANVPNDFDTFKNVLSDDGKRSEYFDYLQAHPEFNPPPNKEVWDKLILGSTVKKKEDTKAGPNGLSEQGIIAGEGGGSTLQFKTEDANASASGEQNYSGGDWGGPITDGREKKTRELISRKWEHRKEALKERKEALKDNLSKGAVIEALPAQQPTEAPYGVGVADNTGQQVAPPVTFQAREITPEEKEQFIEEEKNIDKKLNINKYDKILIDTESGEPIIFDNEDEYVKFIAKAYVTGKIGNYLPAEEYKKVSPYSAGQIGLDVDVRDIEKWRAAGNKPGEYWFENYAYSFLKAALSGGGDIVDWLEIVSNKVGSSVGLEKEGNILGIGKAIKKTAEQLFPEDPDKQKSFYTKIFQGAGSSVPFIAAAIATGGAGAYAQAAMTGAMGGMQNGAAMYREALASGADENTAWQALLQGTVVGGTEAFPIIDILQRADRVMGGTLKKVVIPRIIKNIALGSAEEATQEFIQGIANNMTAQQLYDFSRELMDGVWENAAIGAIVGGIFSASVENMDGKTEDERRMLAEAYSNFKAMAENTNKNLLEQGKKLEESLKDKTPEKEEKKKKELLQAIDEKEKEIAEAPNKTEASKDEGAETGGAFGSEEDVQPDKQDESVRMDDLVGKKVKYSGIEGTLSKEDDGYYVEDKNGEKTLIESGESGKTPDELGIKYNEKEIKGPIVETDFENNKVRLRGKDYEFVSENTDKDGNTVSVTLKDNNGNKVTVRNEDAVDQIVYDKILFENDFSQTKKEDIDETAKELGIKESPKEVQDEGQGENTSGVEEEVQSGGEQGQEIVPPQEGVGDRSNATSAEETKTAEPNKKVEDDHIPDAGGAIKEEVKKGLDLEKRESKALDDISGANPHAKDELHAIKKERDAWIDELFKNNTPDDNADEVHDAVMDSEDGVIDMPEGYRATVIYSYYKPILGRNHTIVHVESPIGKGYYLNVSTYDIRNIGEVYESNVGADKNIQAGGKHARTNQSPDAGKKVDVQPEAEKIGDNYFLKYDKEKEAERDRLDNQWRDELDKNGVTNKSEKLRKKLFDFNKKNFYVKIEHSQGEDLSGNKIDKGQINYSDVTGWADPDNIFFKTNKNGKYVPTELGRMVNARLSSSGGSAFIDFDYSKANAGLIADVLEKSGYKVFDSEQVKASDKSTEQKPESENRQPKESPEQQKKKAARREKQRAKRAKQTLSYKASQVEPTDAYGITMQYFAAGGKINRDALRKLYGKSNQSDEWNNKQIEKERRGRISYVSDKHGRSIDQIAHMLWEENEHLGYTTYDFRDAVEQFINEYTHPAQAARDLIDRYDLEQRKFANQGHSDEEIADMQRYEEEQKKKEKEIEDEIFANSIEELEEKGLLLTPEQEAEIFGHIINYDNEERSAIKKDDGIRDTKADEEIPSNEAGSTGNDKGLSEYQKEVAKEIDDKIATLDEQIKAARKARDKKLAELQNRNGLFGDTKQSESDRMLFEGTFDPSKEAYQTALKPFYAKIAELERQKEELLKGRGKAIEAASKQTEIKESPKEAEESTVNTQPKVDKWLKKVHDEIKKIAGITGEKAGALTRAVDVIRRNIAKRMEITVDEYSKRLSISTVTDIDNATRVELRAFRIAGGDISSLKQEEITKRYTPSNKYVKAVKGVTSSDYWLIKAMELSDRIDGNNGLPKLHTLGTKEAVIEEIGRRMDGLVSDVKVNIDKYLITHYKKSFVEARIEEAREKNMVDEVNHWEAIRDNPAYEKDVIERKAEEQKRALLGNVEYLNGNEDYSIEFRYLTLLDMLKNRYALDENGNVVRKKVKPSEYSTTEAPIQQLNYGALSRVFHEHGDKGDVYVGANHLYEIKNAPAIDEVEYKKFDKYKVHETDDWVLLKFNQGESTDDANNLYEIAATSHKYPAQWCTGGSAATAASQLQGGDFYVFVDKTTKDARIAVRYDGHDKIGEVRGLGEGQSVLPEDSGIMDYIVDNMPDGKEYKSYRDVQKKIIALRDGELKVSDLSKEDAIQILTEDDRSYGGRDELLKSTKEMLSSGALVEAGVFENGELMVTYGYVTPYDKSFAQDLLKAKYIIGGLVVNGHEDGIFSESIGKKRIKVNAELISGDIYVKGNVKVDFTNLREANDIDIFNAEVSFNSLTKAGTFSHRRGSITTAPKLESVKRLNIEDTNLNLPLLKEVETISTIIKPIRIRRARGEKAPIIKGGVVTLPSLEFMGDIYGDNNDIIIKADKLSRVRELPVDSSFKNLIAPNIKEADKGSTYIDATNPGEIINRYGNTTVRELGIIGKDGNIVVFFNNTINEAMGKANKVFHQNDRGVIIKSPDKTKILFSKKNADPTTVLHEMAHEYERVLTDDEVKALEEWSGHKKGTKEFSEAFATGAEKFIYEGTSGNTKVDPIFARIAKWIQDMINNISDYFGGINELNEAVREIYSAMLANHPDIAAAAEKTKAEVEKSRGDLNIEVRNQSKNKDDGIPQRIIDAKIKAAAYAYAQAVRESGVQSFEDFFDRVPGKVKEVFTKQELEEVWDYTKNPPAHDIVDDKTYRERLKRFMGKLNKKYVKISESGVKKGKGIGPAGRRKIEIIKKLMKKGDRVKIWEQIESLTKSIDTAENEDEVSRIFDEIEAHTVALQALDPQQLTEAEKRLDGIIDRGKSELREKLDKERAEAKRLATGGVRVITKGKGIKRGMKRNKLKERRSSKIRRGIDALASLFNKLERFRNLLDIIDRGPREENNWGGFFDKEVYDPISRSRQKSDMFTVILSNKIRDKYKEVYKTKSMAAVRRELENNSVPHDIGEFENGFGEKETLRFSQNQAYRVYQLRKRPDAVEIFTEMGWTKDMVDAVMDYLRPEVIEWADFQMQEIYPFIYKIVAPAFKENNNIELSQIENYVPWIHEGVDEGLLREMDEHDSRYIQIMYSALKERQFSKLPFDLSIDGDALMYQHMARMIHYAAFSTEIKKITKLFSNRDIREAIRQNNPASIVNEIDNMINSISKQGLQNEHTIKLIDKLRKWTTLSSLGLAPPVLVKQLASWPAYISEVPIDEFFKGMAYLAAHPQAALKIINSSDYIKLRLERGMDRDVAEAMMRDYKDALANAGNIRSLLMVMVKWGDIGAIYMGGYSVYHYHYNRLKGKIGKEEAHKEALRQFEEATKLSQQSNNPEDLGSLQKAGSIAKLFTIYKTSPISYMQMERKAIRDLMRGNNKKNAFKRLMIYHFVLPMLFEYISNGAPGLLSDWDDEDEKDLLRAGILGSANGLFIFSDLLGYVVDKASGKPWARDLDPSLTPVFAPLVKGMWSSVEMLNASISGDPQELLKATQDLIVAGSDLVGIPATRSTKIYDNWQMILGDKYPGLPLRDKIGLGLGYSPYVIIGDNYKKYPVGLTKEIIEGLDDKGIVVGDPSRTKKVPKELYLTYQDIYNKMLAEKLKARWPYLKDLPPEDIKKEISQMREEIRDEAVAQTKYFDFKQKHK